MIIIILSLSKLTVRDEAATWNGVGSIPYLKSAAEPKTNTHSCSLLKVENDG